jgi:alpha-L-fucosidase
MSTPYKDGKGDILKELSESCRKYGLKLGVYLSPADLYQIENKEGLYGNLSKYTERIIPRPIEGRPFENKTTFKFIVDDYNEYFLNQLFELLTEYGPVHEVWFDGAHPKRKGGQTYNYLAWKELIHTLAPEAVIFGKQDIRWCGNESGKTRDTEWNVIPYPENPDEMTSFPDLRKEDLGSRRELMKAKYLRYQPAETNTSIREGWFYRDDSDQGVRSADDVFDIYERSVGGNSIFLLNIPPNREGRFSPRDVATLKEVGKRIDETYSTNFLAGANGPKKVLDSDIKSFELLSDEKKWIEIITPSEITINRFVIQEAITTHGERVEEHALDAWIENNWKEITTATNIGYKRILRFPEVTSNKFRIRILKSRYYPAISNISAHHYKTRPPQLEILSNVDGIVSIQPQKHKFGWKPHGEDIISNLNSGIEIRYTTDGSVPSKSSKLYTGPFQFSAGELKAIAFEKEEAGTIASNRIGIVKKNWKLVGTSSDFEKNIGEKAFDGKKETYWQSKEKDSKHSISIDLGESYKIKEFAYTPQTKHADGMIEKGTIKISKNGKLWETVENFEFGNLINDPTIRKHYFKTPIETRYIKIESTVIAGGNKTAAIAEIDFL